MGKRVAPDIKYVRVANAYKMVSYTLILLKKFAARPRRDFFFIAKGGGENFSVAKMKNFAQVPDLISESLDPPRLSPEARAFERDVDCEQRPARPACECD